MMVETPTLKFETLDKVNALIYAAFHLILHHPESLRLIWIGDIAFLSQSGALCTAILDYAKGENIGFSKFISMGNKADIADTDIMLLKKLQQLFPAIQCKS